MSAAASAQPTCEQKRILLGRFQADLRVYIQCSANLGKHTGTAFDAAYKHAEGARIAFERSRLALNKHTAEHGC